MPKPFPRDRDVPLRRVVRWGAIAAILLAWLGMTITAYEDAQAGLPPLYSRW